MESEETPEFGNVRVNGEGRVEHYDGTTWLLYGELPDDGPGGGMDFRAPGSDDPGES